MNPALLAFIFSFLNPPFSRGMPHSTPYAFTPIDEHTHPAIGKLAINGEAYCSAELVDEDSVITAAHCLGQPGQELWLDGHIYEIDHTDILLETDMAIFTLKEKPPIEPLHISMDRANFGDPVIIVGNGEGKRRQSNPGALYATGMNAEAPCYIMLYTGHATCWPGDSGGALLRDGKLIGIINYLRVINGEVVDNGCSSILYSLAWLEAHGYDPIF